MAKVTVRSPNERQLVKMYNMKNGAIGRITSSSISAYGGDIVMACTSVGENKIHVFSLGVPGRYWTHPIGDGGVEVEILPAGTVVEITV